MRRLNDPTVTAMWCVVGGLALLGIVVALATMVWGSG
jgi:hypothetical protein